MINNNHFRSALAGIFTKTAVTQKRKVKKLIPKLLMNSLSEGHKRTIDSFMVYVKGASPFGVLWQKWTFGPKTEIPGPKIGHFLRDTMFWQ